MIVAPRNIWQVQSSLNALTSPPMAILCQVNLALQTAVFVVVCLNLLTDVERDPEIRNILGECRSVIHMEHCFWYLTIEGF